MNRKWQSVLLCLSLVALTVVILSACSPSIGRQKWEYEVVQPSLVAPDIAESLGTQLNQLGAEGWDCSISPMQAIIVCKRPL